MKKRIGLRIKALAVFLIPYTLYLIPYTFAQRNNFRAYSIEDGLPQTTVNSIIQDNRGYLWLGTEGGGLCRFDGARFKIYNKKNGFSADIIRTLLQDRKGRIWAGTKEAGIIIYDGLKFHTINEKNGLKGSTVLSLFENKDGVMWAGTDDGGLNKITPISYSGTKDSYGERGKEGGLDSFRIQVIDESKGLSNNSVFDIYKDKTGHLWLATFGGINILTLLSNEGTAEVDSFQIDILRGGREIPSNWITSVQEDSKGALWFGTYDAGAFRMDLPVQSRFRTNNFKLEVLSRKITVFNSSNGFNAKSIWNIYLTNKNELWFSTVENGVIRHQVSLEGNNPTSGKFIFEQYTNKEGLPDNQIMCLFEDKEGNIWIGTGNSGLCKFMGDKFSHFTEKDGLPGIVTGIDQDLLGNFWVTTNGGGLTKMMMHTNMTAFENYTVKDGLSSNSLLAVSSGKTPNNPYTWVVAAGEGIAKFNGKTFTNFSETQGLVDNNAYSIFVDLKGIVWCGAKEGISRFDGVKFVNSDMQKLMISDKDVNVIIQNKEGNLWFGTGGGLAKYNGDGSITTYDEVEGLQHKYIKTLVEGVDGNIWIGTNNGGLYMFDVHTQDKMKIRLVANDSLLSSNSISSIIFQDEKTLIAGTNKGFDKIIFDKKWNIIEVQNYNASDGFIGVECNDNAIYKDKAGNIWFGTVKGLTRYNPANENINNNPPQTHITAIKLFYKDMDWGKRVDSLIPWFNLPYQLELPYTDNHLTFQFSAISMENPQKIRYRYMLEGLETDWSPPTTQTERDYPGLSPGIYTFKVKAAGANGVWSSRPATFTFITINPPWYRTTWFYVLCAVTTLLSIYFYIRIRERALIREKKILEDKVVERTAKVVKQKEELEEQKHVIEEKNKDITDSINYAQKIQSAILPDPEKIKKALPESFILFQPRDIVSGDFFWYNEVMQNDSTLYLLAAADCTGHGVPGAFMSMINTSLLNEATNEKKILQPNEILNEVRKGIIRSLKQKGESGEQKDGMDVGIVSLKFAANSLQKEKNQLLPIAIGTNCQLQYAGANNSMYIIRKSDAPVLEEIDPDPMPVAISDRTGDFTNHIIEIKKGDSFYIFTDGYADQFGGPKGKKFKYAQFKQLLLSMQNKSMDEQKEILDKSMAEWKGTLEQIDDILVIGVRV